MHDVDARAFLRALLGHRDRVTLEVLAVRHEDDDPHVVLRLRVARELIEELNRRNAAIALVTGNLSAIGWRKIELARLKHFFHCGAFSEDGSTRAELAHLATKRARQQNHAASGCRVFLIGDHRNDIEAAKANGIRSIAVATGPMPAAELRTFEPDVFLESLADLDVNLLFS